MGSEPSIYIGSSGNNNFISQNDEPIPQSEADEIFYSLAALRLHKIAMPKLQL